MTDHDHLDQLCINTIRTLAMDAVQKAKSGHPGMPMGAAAMAYVLWTRFLKFNPKNPDWPDRDRFILSAGHGSMLLYSLLYLTGYDLPLEQLQQFRQWGSMTPGHPERGLAPGVEVTSGPLGQGFGNGVGAAIAERFLAAHFNRPGHTIVDHYTYAIVSDGDLMEGVASEAASLAGHLKLGKLIYLYDDNDISIEGSTQLTFTEDVGRRFEAYGWHVQHVEGNDLEGVAGAIRAAQRETERPSLIIARTHIGYGSPHKQDSEKAHGEPLGEEEVRLTKANLGWPPDAQFLVPEAALAHFRKAIDWGRAWEEEWRGRFEAYAAEFPELARQWHQFMNRDLPAGWEADIPTFKPADGPVATRAASGKVLNALAPHVLNLIGGSADLAPSTNTLLKGFGDFEPGENGRNLHFGVREHSMGTILNGMAAHGGVIPYGATFLVFSDYMRPSIRLAALSKLHCILVFTHDSIGVGEDGPTHQAVEHLAALRAIPDLTVIRPADANETAEAWRVALSLEGPVALALTRQALPILDRATFAPASGLAQGAYVLAEGVPVSSSSGQFTRARSFEDHPPRPDAILIATGSEVALAVEAREKLAGRGVAARVVSMPSWELFDRQPQAYRDQVLPPEVTARLAIEAGVSQGWCKYVGNHGDVIGVDRFGASAPGKVVMEEYGFTSDHVVARALAVLAKASGQR